MYFVAHLLRSLVQSGTARDERGASAVEYGLLVAGIAAMLVTAVFLLGDSIDMLFGDSCGTITNWVKNGSSC